MSVVKSALQYPVLIAYLEGANNYTWVYFRSGERKLLAKPISYVAQLLHDFVRIHKTVVVNPACVVSFQPPARTKMPGSVAMENGVVLPVSRRRWLDTVQLLSVAHSLAGSLPEEELSQPVQAPESVVASLWVITDNQPCALLVKNRFRQHWPHYHVDCQPPTSDLIGLLEQRPTAQLPLLVLMDARTATGTVLALLQRLKQHQQLMHIPVALLVSTTPGAMEEGYQRQANSVMALSSDPTQLVSLVDRINQFWLKTAALPTP